MAYGKGMFVAVAQNGAGNRIMTSSDSVTWTCRPAPEACKVPGACYWKRVRFGNGMFVAVGFSDYKVNVMTSLDGVTWTTRSTPAPKESTWATAAYGGGQWVAVGGWYNYPDNRVMTSTDAMTWTIRSTPNLGKHYSGGTNYLNDVVYGKGLWVAVSEGGHSGARQGTGTGVMTSPDGTTWTIRVTTTDRWFRVTYGNNMFVAIANNPKHFSKHVMTSTDGVTWTIRKSPFSWAFSGAGIVYGEGVFVAINGGQTEGRVMTSTDGMNWSLDSTNYWIESPPFDPNVFLLDMTYGNGKWVGVAFTRGTSTKVVLTG